MTTVALVLSSLLSVFFVFAGSVKVFGWQKLIFETQLAFFKSYGFNRQFMGVVGVIEMLAALGLWWPQTIIAAISAMVIATVSAGAIACHLRYDSAKNAIAAMVTLSLSVTLLALNESLAVF